MEGQALGINGLGRIVKIIWNRFGGNSKFRKDKSELKLIIPEEILKKTDIDVRITTETTSMEKRNKKE